MSLRQVPADKRPTGAPLSGATPCDVAGLVRPGVIVSRPMAVFTSTALDAWRVPDVYGGIRPRVNVRSLLSGLETDRRNG